MRKRNHKRYWDSLPKELVMMSSPMIRSYTGSAIVQFVAENMYVSEPSLSETLQTDDKDVIRWIDFALESLYPLEFYTNQQIWRNNKSIYQMLCRAEELLGRLTDNPDETEDSHNRIGFKQYYCQKIHAFKCVWAMFARDNSKLKTGLKQVLEDTKCNVKDMINLPDEVAYEYVTEDDWAEFHYPTVDEIETINMIGREHIEPWARQLVARAYEEYATFLKALPGPSSRAVLHMRENAEKYLSDICLMALDEIDDVLEDADNDLCIAEKEIFESMLKRSEERSDETEKYDNPSEGAADSSSKYFYKNKWGATTLKLRKIMIDNPTIPVVVTLQNGQNYTEPDCAVGYIHDPVTGEFKEKIIAIYDAKDSFTADSDDDLFDLPF